ncbi:MAG TPA: lamin tail domain-containing protein [Chthoniobacteraceae bacterium]|nr:lamin tail domain-containing protein [Chthoniobacteraceae bacterium]
MTDSTPSASPTAPASSPLLRSSSILVVVALAFLALLPSKAFSQVFISEFLADNQVNSTVDEDGDHVDWLELWNSGPTPVNLNGWYLTDDAGDLRKWRFPVTTPAVNISAGGRLLIYASSKDRKLLANRLHTNFKLSKPAGGYLALVQPDGLAIQHAYASYPQQIQDIAYGLPLQTQFQALVNAGASGKAKVPLDAAGMPAGWNGNGAFDDSTWLVGTSGFGYDTAGTYGALLGAGGDLQAAMHLQNSTALIRIPFNISNLSQILSLRLSMKYDDGYLCYLNGTLIASSNAPGSPTWNSGASFDRNGALTSTYEVVNLATAHNFLVNGTNMLAFQLLNFTNGSTQDVDNQGTPNGSRALCMPLLEGNVNVGVGDPTYLLTATPGANNSGPRTAVGPLISNTTNSAVRPAGGAGSLPILITTTVVPSLRPLATTNPVLLRYRVQFGGEQVITMRDDGIAPDTAAGDSVYAALLPTTGVTQGQMLRWRVSASDNNSPAALSTDPPFLDTTDNDQYYGTVAEDAGSQGIMNSNLPILHWFVQDAAGSRAEGGTRCSLYYLGRFYDNVFVNLHGQSSSGFPVNKKSHDFNFNEDNRFVWKLGEPAQRAINLLSNYADKAKVRNTVSWESWSRASHLASHYAFPIRVQQNGSFWGVYDMVENGDEDFLERTGLDVNGAFYKMYNSLDNATTDVEKKTRKNESNSDLQALITGLDPAQAISNRRRFSYDNVDIPALVNYLAANVLILNRDFGHKNYYIYRHTNGSREWSLLPWDQDLSLGHTWTSSQNYFNDDIHTQQSTSAGSELPLGGGGNRLMNMIMTTNSSAAATEMVQMFLRRTRSLMDKNLVSATETNGPWEQRINQLVDLIDPPGADFLTDGDRDLQMWGYWTDGNGASLSGAGQDAATHNFGIRKQALRILSANPSPPYPASTNNAEGLNNTVPPYLPGRRARLYNGGLSLVGLPVPAAQTANPTGLTIETVDFNPGNQNQEYFIIRNNSGTYVDLSDWKITGAVTHTFHGGTVIPPFTSGSAINATGDVHNGRLHVARNALGFRSRSVSPKGNEFRLVVGGYKGQLSARGETINLVKPGATPEEDVIIATTTYAGNPTATQNFLRVTELNFNPAPPTPAELLEVPGIQGSDFEFIELINIDVSPLNLGGAFFDKGVSFTFPANFTLQPGQRCVIVALQAAYDLRYAGQGALVAGQFEGNLSNAGETLQVLDVSGEEILEFTYDPDWYGVPSGSAGGLTAVQGYSLVTRSNVTGWNAYENPASWALSGTGGGTPGGGDTVFSNVYIGWRKDFFTPEEELNSLLGPLTADPDGDARNNFKEYVFGGNPRVADFVPDASGSRVNVGGIDYLAITFNRRFNALDTTYIIEASSDLVSWQPVHLPVGTPTSLGNGLERVTFRDSQAIDGNNRYLRVRALRQ